MKPILVYYGHRYRDADPAKQAENLARACVRFCKLRDSTTEVIYFAPWLELALADVPEALALPVIRAAIAASDEVILDLDGSYHVSTGLADEWSIADEHGKHVTASIDALALLDEPKLAAK